MAARLRPIPRAEAQWFLTVVLELCGTMSDLNVPPELVGRGELPLQASAYFDPALFQREMDTIFRHGPRYLGHQLAVPEPGDFYTLPQEGDGRALVRTPNSVEVISNVCRHRRH